jgi:hypothetical protein
MDYKPKEMWFVVYLTMLSVKGKVVPLHATDCPWVGEVSLLFLLNLVIRKDAWSASRLGRF